MSGLNRCATAACFNTEPDEQSVSMPNPRRFVSCPAAPEFPADHDERPRPDLTQLGWRTRASALRRRSGSWNVPIAHRTLTVQQLVEFTNEHNCWELRTFEVVDTVIKPSTLDAQTRYHTYMESKLDWSSEPADVFVSHTWGGKWGLLVAACVYLCREDAEVMSSFRTPSPLLPPPPSWLLVVRGTGSNP